MNWFRVELDKSGAILKCEQVEAKESGGRYVRFIEASTKAEACSAAKAWHEAKKARNRAGDKVRAELRKKQGLCRKCTNRARRAGLCEAHHAAAIAAQRRSRTGESTPRPALSADEAQARARGQCRASPFRVCLRRFDELGPERFRAWLVAEIERRSLGGPGAALDLSDNEGQPFHAHLG